MMTPLEYCLVEDFVKIAEMVIEEALESHFGPIPRDVGEEDGGY